MERTKRARREIRNGSLGIPAQAPFAISNCSSRYSRQTWQNSEVGMPRSMTTLTLDDAKRMLRAGEHAAGETGLAYNLAIVDAGAHLVAFIRQDDALIGSIDLAISKAVTARLFDKPTAQLADLAQPRQPLFGIQQSNHGEVVIFGGGLLVRLGDEIVGAVGASAGTVEQDVAVAQAMIAAFNGGSSSPHDAREEMRLRTE
ncbi:GlcG/HbpS family heme-binding protein [Sphingomonas trueperi]|uniref:GlcG/HbpS family heme-binding protein n=1 Tax=Sphingomonas trueperi TaxID=53317 RepID=UPI00339B0078